MSSLQLEADGKRGVARAIVPLVTGNAFILTARGLHIDRFNKQKAQVEVAFKVGTGFENTLAYTDLDIRDDKDRTHLANSARRHLEGPKGAKSDFDLDLVELSESVCRHLMDEFCRAFPIALFESQGAKRGSAGDTIKPLEMMIPCFVQRYGGHLLFAPKGSGKTTIAILMALCMENGIDLFGNLDRCYQAMFLQMERSEEVFLSEVQKCCRALGLPIGTPILYRVERGRSLAGMVDAIQRDVDKNKVDILFVDSVSRLSEGGSLKDDNTSNAVMDRLNSLAPCHFDLGHTSWEGKGDPKKAHMFGSVMFGNAADVVIQGISQKDRANNRMGVELTVTDANAFAEGHSVLLALEFDALGLKHVRRADKDEFPELAEAHGYSTLDKILDYMNDVGAVDATTTAKALNLERPTVARYFTDKDRNKGQIVYVKKDGRESLYGPKSKFAREDV